MSKVKIMVIDDEPAIRKLLKRGLVAYDYVVLTAVDGAEGLTLTKEQNPDLVLLDINFSEDPDGLEICRKLRGSSKIPIIMLTVRDEKEVKLAALNAGADDYMTKPFDMDELEARIRAVLRRSAYEAAKSGTGEIQVGHLVVNLINRRVMLDGEEVHLTPNEYALLKVLATHPGKVLTFGMLLEEVWGQSDNLTAAHKVRVYINTLRKKLRDDLASTPKPRFIFNEPGVGYRFADLPMSN